MAVWIESSYRPVLRDYLPSRPIEASAGTDKRFDPVAYFRRELAKRKAAMVPAGQVFAPLVSRSERFREAAHILRPLVHGTPTPASICT